MCVCPTSLIGNFAFQPKALTAILPKPPPPISSQSNQLSLPIDLPTPSRRTVVVIDPGHGESDPGSVSNQGSLKESDITLDIALKVASFLREKNIEVVMTRDRDIELDLEPRVSIAERFKGKVAAFVSIHVNGMDPPRPDINGLETYYYQSGADLARAIHDSVLQGTGIRDRGVRTARFYVLRKTSMPSALIETGILTGSEDYQKLANSEFRLRMAKAIARGILRYLG